MINDFETLRKFKDKQANISENSNKYILFDIEE